MIELPEVNAAAAPRSYFFFAPTRPILLISSAGRPIFSAISWILRVRRLVAFEPAEKLGRHTALRAVLPVGQNSCAILVSHDSSKRLCSPQIGVRKKSNFLNSINRFRAFSLSPQNNSLAENQKQRYIPPIPPREEGRSANRHDT